MAGAFSDSVAWTASVITVTSNAEFVLLGNITPSTLPADIERAATILAAGWAASAGRDHTTLENDRTTAISPSDLLKFITACGHTPRVIAFDRSTPGLGAGMPLSRTPSLPT